MQRPVVIREMSDALWINKAAAVKKMLYLLLFFFSQLGVRAAIKDSLSATEMAPVFATMVLQNNDTLYGYVEYHDYIKEYLSIGISNQIVYATNPKFPYKEKTLFNATDLTYLQIGHDEYRRILNDSNHAGILAKALHKGRFVLYEYRLSDFKDMKLRDSTYRTALGFSETKYEFLLLEPSKSEVFLFDMLNEHKELPASLLRPGYHYIINADEFKIELSLLSKNCSSIQKGELPQKFNWKEIMKWAAQLNPCE